MFVEELVLQKDVSDILENRCWSEGKDCLEKTEKQLWLPHVYINLKL